MAELPKTKGYFAGQAVGMAFVLRRYVTPDILNENFDKALEHIKVLKSELVSLEEGLKKLKWITT